MIMIGSQTIKADSVWPTGDTIDVFSAPYGSTFNVCYRGHGIWLKSGPIDNGGWYDWNLPSGSHSTYIIYYDPQIEGYYSLYIPCSRGDGNTAFYLTFHQPQTSTQSLTICQGESITVGSHTYTSTGTYIDTLQAVNSCDSIVTTHLTVNPAPTPFTVTGGGSYCNDGSLEPSIGTSGSETGVEYRLWSGLTLVDMKNGTGSPLTFSNSYSQGNFTVTASNSCDTIILGTTSIVLNQGYLSTTNFTICEGDSIFIHGNWESQSGNYDLMFTTINGCDSIVRTHLTINPTALTQQNMVECAGFSIVVGSHTYTTSGMYYDTLQTSNGCDSIVTTHLIINPLPTLGFTDDTIVIYSGENLTLIPNDSNTTSYLWSTGETTQEIVVDSTGTYYVTVSNNCGSAIDSIQVEVITGLPANKMSKSVNIYPNPAQNFIKISGYNQEIGNIEIYSQDGRLVMALLDKRVSTQIDISILTEGIYTLKIDGTAKPIRFIKLQ